MNTRLKHRIDFLGSKKLTVTAFALFAILFWAGNTDLQAQTALGGSMPMINQSFTGVDGSSTQLSKIKGDNGTVVVFWCASCPWVKKYEDRMSSLIADYSDKGFGFVLVNSNDPVAYPEDNMDAMKAQASAGSYDVPYVVDEGSSLAKALGAKRTPHTFVFDSNNILQYIGAIDDSPSNADKVKDSFLRLALDAMISGGEISVKESKSFGCKIKMQS